MVLGGSSSVRGEAVTQSSALFGVPVATQRFCSRLCYPRNPFVRRGGHLILKSRLSFPTDPLQPPSGANEFQSALPSRHRSNRRGPGDEKLLCYPLLIPRAGLGRVVLRLTTLRRQKRSSRSPVPFIRSHLASAGCAAGQRGGQAGQPGWPGVQPQPMAKQMKRLSPAVPRSARLPGRKGLPRRPAG